MSSPPSPDAAESSPRRPATADPAGLLGRPNSLRFVVLTAVAAFGTYFCMYAFRKPFAVAEFAGQSLWGIDYKVVLIISQVAGYTASKFIGIKVVSEMPRRWRVATLLSLIAAAELALVGFGATPPPYNWWWLVLNGLPLGMIWGLVFAFLEGRHTSEVLAMVLSASFISASGVVKGVGLFTIEQWGVSEYWMPAVTGALFFPPLLAFVWLLNQTPPPSREDETERSRRQPMDGRMRWEVIRSMSLGLALLVFSHMLLTALRDYRDKFTNEILAGMDEGKTGFIAASEVYVMFAVLAPLALLMLVRSHARAVTLMYAAMAGGFALAGVSTLAFQAGQLGLAWWFIVVGVGLYLAYVPFQSILFDRLLALTRQPGNAGYLLYIGDATGYLSSVAVLLYKEFGSKQSSPLEFFCQATLVSAVAGAASVLVALGLLLVGRRGEQPAAPSEAEPVPTA